MAKITNVLSLFDGLSCGQIALNRAGIEYDNYFASEIDKHAIQVTQTNYPKTIQLGDVTKVKVKLLCLSEVYSYICSYDSNLQSNISEWEVLYWLNKDFTLSAKIRTQKPNERQEVSEPSTVQRIKEVWFSNREMGSVRKFGDYTRSRSNGEENDIRTPKQLQCGKWWYDNDIYRRYKEENIGITIGKTKNGDSEKKNFGNIEGEIFKRRESESCFRENEKINVEKRCSGELFERKREDRFSREVEKEKGNRRTKEGNFIDEVIRELCRWDESNGITQDYWSLLRLHKEEQITVVEYEEGFYLFKGRIDLCIGGSPCQGFSFAGKQLAFDDPRSKLFFEFVRLVKEMKPKYWLLENVKMKKEFEIIISKYMGVAPIEINSALLSAQNRVRLYWTNIANEAYGLFGDMQCMIPQPKDKGILLRDILESDVPDKYYLSEKAIATVNRKSDIGINPKINPDKSGTVTCGNQSAKFGIDNSTTLIVASRGRNPENPKSRESGLNTEQMLEPRYDGKTNCLTSVQKDNLVLLNERQKANHKNEDEKANTFLSTSWKGSQANGMTLVGTTKIRRLTPTECERLQTVPDGYTSIVSDTQRYRMLGNGWTVDVIAHIFSFMALQKPKSEGEKNIIAE
jgi:DNA (cytosine-5)-methyltransferase 1